MTFKSEEPKEIFLAEDNRGDVYLIRKAIQDKGLPHRMFVAEDGEQASQYLESIGKGQQCPDIILLDLNLPKQEGHGLLRQLREHPDCRSKPVIVISSSDFPKDHELVEELGATFFRKPADLEEFLRIGDLVLSMIVEN